MSGCSTRSVSFQESLKLYKATPNQLCYNINAMFRKQVKCYRCGFLAIHESSLANLMPLKTLEDVKTASELGFYSSHECTQQGREHIANSTHPNPSILTCTRNVWSGSDFTDKPKETVFQFLNSKRKCPYFFPYNPSYSPSEHRELQQETKTQRLLIIGTLLGALIGALAAILGQLIARG